MIGSFALAASLAWAGARVGGPYDIEYESLNSGGISFASNGVIKLGGSLGQHGLAFLRTNGAATVRLAEGFWKPDTACEMYPPTVTAFVRGTGTVAITFGVMASNTYTVLHLNQEGGGLTNGLAMWTNIVAGPFAGQGGPGSSTTIYATVSSSTNIGRFYIVRCQ